MEVPRHAPAHVARRGGVPREMGEDRPGLAARAVVLREALAQHGARARFVGARVERRPPAPRAAIHHLPVDPAQDRQQIVTRQRQGEGRHVGLRVAAIRAQRVQLHHLAREVLVGAAPPAAAERAVGADGRAVVEIDQHGGVQRGRPHQLLERAPRARLDRFGAEWRRQHAPQGPTSAHGEVVAPVADPALGEGARGFGGRHELVHLNLALVRPDGGQAGSGAALRAAHRGAGHARLGRRHGVHGAVIHSAVVHGGVAHRPVARPGGVAEPRTALGDGAFADPHRLNGSGRRAVGGWIADLAQNPSARVGGDRRAIGRRRPQSEPCHRAQRGHGHVLRRIRP